MRKTIKYIILNTICAIFLIAVSTFIFNAEKVLYVSVYKNPEYRTLVVSPRYNGGYDVAKDLEELNKIEHIKEIYDNNLSEVVLSETSLKNGFVDGTIRLKRFTDEVKVVKGSSIADETGVAICPTVLYADSNPLNADKKRAKNGYKLLNTEFKVKYENKEKTFKIIGVYNTNDIFSDNGTCFVNEKDIKEIKSGLRGKYSSFITMTNPFNIVVDDKENLSSVKESLLTLGFDNWEDAKDIDSDLLIIIHLVPITLLLFLILMVYMNTEKYIYRRKKHQVKLLERVRTSELLKCNIAALALGFLIFLVTYTILIKNIPFLITMDALFEVDLFIPLILPLVVYLGIPLIIKK